MPVGLRAGVILLLVRADLSKPGSRGVTYALKLQALFRVSSNGLIGRRGQLLQDPPPIGFIRCHLGENLFVNFNSSERLAPFNTSLYLDIYPLSQ